MLNLLMTFLMINICKIKINLVSKKKIKQYFKIQDLINFLKTFIKKRYYQNRIHQNRLSGRWDKD